MLLRQRQFFTIISTLILILGFSISGIGVLELAAAPLTDVIISEYIEGSSNNKAIEIYNGTGAPINLGTGGYVLQMYFNGSASAGLNITLTGTVAAGDVYVVAQSSANATILAQADQTNGSGWYNGDDAVVLRKGGVAGTVLDSLGQVGVDPGSEWGSALLSTADNTLRRLATVCVGDTVINDVPAFTEWDGFATDTFDGLGSHSDSCGGGDALPTVVSTNPADNATDVPLSPAISINFSEDVTVSGAWFSVVCNAADVSGNFTVSGGASSYTLTYGGAPLTGGANCLVTVNAANVADSIGQNLASNYSFDFTLVAPLTITKIHSIQGTGAAVTGSGPFTVEAIVTGDFQTSGEMRGFFIQEEDADIDADSSSSEGIFVFCNNCPTNVAVGDLVRVTGSASENFNQSQLVATSAGAITVLSSGNALPSVTTLDITTNLVNPAADKDSFYEAYEGMLVSISDTMSVAEYFELFRFGELVLYQGGRPYQYTHVDNSPSAGEFNAYNDDLSRRRIVLDDGSNAQNRPLSISPQELFYPYPNGFGVGTQGSNYFRGGDTISGLTGLLGYGFSEWRLQPSQSSYSFNPVNTRPSVPSLGGNVTVASYNVLNYFTTIDTTSSNDVGTCGPSGTMDCRGADSAAELARQTEKLVQALAAIDADIFGLIEIENSSTTLASLVNSLNAVVGAGTYGYVDTGVVGTDAITVALIYKTGVVEPVAGGLFIDTDAVNNRPTVAQTFRVIDLANMDYGGTFTVVVNHFKSKGSACGAGDDDTTTGQGNCNGTRTAQANRLLTWINGTIIPATGDSDVLIIGDLNSYRGEDPIRALETGGYTNLVDSFLGANAYSYVFDGMLGYLDHALGSASMTAQVVGVADWHINADEVPVFDYNDDVRDGGEASFEEEPDGNPLYEANAFRTSDHDPVLIALDLDVAAPSVIELTLGGNFNGVIRSGNMNVVEAMFERVLREAGISRTSAQDYILFFANSNGVLDTLTDPFPTSFCAAGANPLGDDIKISFDGTNYLLSSATSLLNVQNGTSPLSTGIYMLVYCASSPSSTSGTMALASTGARTTAGSSTFILTFRIEADDATAANNTGTNNSSAVSVTGSTGSNGAASSTGVVVAGGIDFDGDGIADVTQLPATGETPLWANWVLWIGALLLLSSLSLLLLGAKK